MAETPDTVLSVERLVAGYDETAPVVRGVSLALKRGEIVALFGPNGAGKSTLVKAIAGSVRIFGGHVLCGDVDLVGWPSHRITRHGIGYVPQVANVFTEMTVRENLALARAMRRGPGPSIEDMALIFPDLDRLGPQQAGRLSGGQRQMVAIARALIGAPIVLILDEPSAGLSPKVVSELFDRLRGLKSQASILLVEQNVQAAIEIADRAMLLAEGSLRLASAARDFLAQPEVARSYLGSAS